MREIVSPLSGIRSPFGQLRGTVFSPASLFASGEEGAWYEPSTTTCFTDTAGTTAAGVGDAVARINDSSGNGNHATQGTAAARPILRQTAGGLYYLETDGVDDFLLWNGASIDMTSAVICIAAETTADGYFFDANEDLASSPQNRLGMRRQSGNFVLVDSTSSLRTGGAISGAHVLTGVWATNAGKTRIDGADDTAFGTFVNSSNDVQYMTIGTYYQALGAFFNGKIFGIIARGGGSTAQEISDTETYLAAKSGVTL